jgi:hypothetical protein
MKLNVIIVLLFLSLIVSCEKDNSSIGFEPGPPGSYTYQSFDTLGTLLVTGWLKFEHTDSTQIEGSWELNNVSNRNDIGPQVGNGILLGSIIDSSISMDLNPQFRDHNLYLEGIIKDSYFEGKWASNNLLNRKPSRVA